MPRHFGHLYPAYQPPADFPGGRCRQETGGSGERRRSVRPTGDGVTQATIDKGGTDLMECGKFRKVLRMEVRTGSPGPGKIVAC